MFGFNNFNKNNNNNNSDNQNGDGDHHYNRTASDIATNDSNWSYSVLLFCFVECDILSDSICNQRLYF